MANENLSSLLSAIHEVVQDGAYSDLILTPMINDAISIIASGVRLPNQGISPPLPDLYTIASVMTTAQAYVDLPDNYQRDMTLLIDSNGNKISPLRGGSYYSFGLFMSRVSRPNLSETGSVYTAVIKGRKLYYQGIPSISENLGLHYYRKPTPLVTMADTVDGIPDQFQRRLVKHYVCKEIFGEAIEDGQDNKGIGTRYHTERFYEVMRELADFIGIDAVPVYYGDSGTTDAGACDG